MRTLDVNSFARRVCVGYTHLDLHVLVDERGGGIGVGGKC